MSERDRRFPIGTFQRPAGPLDDRVRGALISDIERLPAEMRAAVEGMTDAELDTPYRPEGWTVRQVVHHVADSHMNAYVRFKLAATEDAPTVKPYEEARWAELPEARTAPVDISLDLIEALHRRWTLCLRHLSAAELTRTYMHPEMGSVPIDAALSLYSWHGKHHTAHILSTRR